MDEIYFKDILSFDGKVDKGSSRKKETIEIFKLLRNFNTSIISKSR